MIWFVIGLCLGYGIGTNKQQANLPAELEKCTTEKSQQDIDIAYYKKLTKKLVEENKTLRTPL